LLFGAQPQALLNFQLYNPNKEQEDPTMKNHRLVALTAAILLSASPLALSVRAAHPNADGVMMHDGKMMIMKNGQAKGPMANSMTMSNGATVMGDGMVKMKDGSETHMKDGQMMMMDGQMMQGCPFFSGRSPH
jgi:hypothetical protein